MPQQHVIDLTNYPELNKRINTPFMQEWIGGEGMPVNGNFMPYAIWNMACSYRDINMWVAFKMKPHPNWKISQCKEYFGIKGNGQKLLDQFEAIKAEVDAIIKNLPDN